MISLKKANSLSKSVLNVNEIYPPCYPPVELITAKLLCEQFRPKDKNPIPYDRFEKRRHYGIARSMFEKHGLRGANYFGLTGIYPDDIAIALHPIIISINGVDINEQRVNALQIMLNQIKRYTDFPIAVEHKDIFSVDIDDSLHNIIDFDFEGMLDPGKCDQIVEFLNNTETPFKVGVMIWASYGRNIDYNDTIDGLDMIVGSLPDFNILDTIRSTYHTNKMPIIHQSMVIKRK